MILGIQIDGPPIISHVMVGEGKCLASWSDYCNELIDAHQQEMACTLVRIYKDELDRLLWRQVCYHDNTLVLSIMASFFFCSNNYFKCLCDLGAL